MRLINFILYLSIAALIAGGLLFVKNNRDEHAVKIIEDLRDKTMIFYSSNIKRGYLDSPNGDISDMERLCTEGASIIKSNGLNSVFLKINEGNHDPYTLSGLYLKKTLKKDIKYILVDISRGQSKHGEKYQAGDKTCCPIKIILSKGAPSYDQSLLFAGRVKSVIDKEYARLPVLLVTDETSDYNQGMGYIGMLVELGDSENTLDEARESLQILCNALREVIYNR